MTWQSQLAQDLKQEILPHLSTAPRRRDADDVWMYILLWLNRKLGGRPPIVEIPVPLLTVARFCGRDHYVRVQASAGQARGRPERDEPLHRIRDLLLDPEVVPEHTRVMLAVSQHAITVASAIAARRLTVGTQAVGGLSSTHRFLLEAGRCHPAQGWRESDMKRGPELDRSVPTLKLLEPLNRIDRSYRATEETQWDKEKGTWAFSPNTTSATRIAAHGHIHHMIGHHRLRVPEEFTLDQMLDAVARPLSTVSAEAAQRLVAVVENLTRLVTLAHPDRELPRHVRDEIVALYRHRDELWRAGLPDRLKLPRDEMALVIWWAAYIRRMDEKREKAEAAYRRTRDGAPASVGSDTAEECRNPRLAIEMSKYAILGTNTFSDFLDTEEGAALVQLYKSVPLDDRATEPDGIEDLLTILENAVAPPGGDGGGEDADGFLPDDTVHVGAAAAAVVDLDDGERTAVARGHRGADNVYRGALPPIGVEITRADETERQTWRTLLGAYQDYFTRCCPRARELIDQVLVRGGSLDTFLAPHGKREKGKIIKEFYIQRCKFWPEIAIECFTAMYGINPVTLQPVEERRKVSTDHAERNGHDQQAS